MSSAQNVPKGWSAHESKSRPGVTYYVNQFTNESVWELPTTEAVKPAATEVRVRHILKKHAGSRRPSSWRVETITQSKEEAMEQIREIKKTLIETLESEGYEAMAEQFVEIAKVESDCGSAIKGGDLGYFGPGAMQKSFEQASFKCKIKELSEFVDSDSGIHVILRVA